MCHDQVCSQQQSDSHGRRNEIVLSDISASAYGATEIRNSERDESNGAADGDSACDKAHYGHEEKGLAKTG